MTCMDVAIPGREGGRPESPGLHHCTLPHCAQGPIASRTSDIGPIAAEFAVFALAAGSPYILSSLLRAPPPPAEQ